MSVNGNDKSPGEGTELPELWALKQAVELLGFDPEELAARMCETTESYWPTLSLGCVTVSFDSQLACLSQPKLSAAVIAEAEAWFKSVRLTTFQTATSRPQPSKP